MWRFLNFLVKKGCAAQKYQVFSSGYYKRLNLERAKGNKLLFE